jgi:hypothetical protein
MQDSLDLQIRDGIMDYLAEQVTMEQFLDRFMDQAEEAEEIGDPELEDLVNTIKLYWAELTGNYLTQQEFRDLLRPFVQKIEVPLQVTDLIPQHTLFAGMPDSQQSGSGSLIYKGSLMDESQRNARYELVIE